MAKKKSSSVKVPLTLIVGLGGKGCDIVSRVDRLTNPEQRKYVRFVFMDTDANELGYLKENSPYCYPVQTSRSITVGQALRNDRVARETTFPVNPQLLNKPLTEGAGQVRAISKLAFDACLREGRIGPLHDAINDLLHLNGESVEQAMRVVIVSTLVGGTGSGILLPLSMYLRHYLETHCQKKPLIRGFCVLPDVFFKGRNKTEVEKNNLRANAYATLRELDAFMLKSDSAFDSDIRKRFHLWLPRPGTIDEYDEYSDSPMDFCFLFDGQNVDGDGLETFKDYMQHAADCIYTSSISKLTKRLSSSEDNTILERCASLGRNRYCGIGTSKLIYPHKLMREYVAYTWMEQVMTSDWLRYDLQFMHEMEHRKISRAKGVTYPPTSRCEEYVRMINNEGDANIFTKLLRDECYNMDKFGVVRKDARWELYYKALKEKIQIATEEGSQQYGGSVMEDIEGLLSGLGGIISNAKKANFGSSVDALIGNLDSLYGLARRYAENNARTYADMLFSPDNFNPKDPSHVEYWLIRNEEPIHPNSVRYFLYSLFLMLKEEKRLEDRTPEGEVSFYDSTSPDDDVPRYADLKSVIAAFSEPQQSFDPESSSGITLKEFIQGSKFKGLRKKDWQKEAENIKIRCSKQFEYIQAFYGACLRVEILNKAIEYVSSMNANYEAFFDALSEEIKRIPRKKERIVEAITNRRGSPIYYVCASPKCREGLLGGLQNTVDSMALTVDFKNKLFKGIFGAMGLDETKRKAHVEEIAGKELLDFWCQQVSGARGSGVTVEMNILGALLAEAYYEGGCETLEDKVKYVERKYDEAMKLAAPFIDRPSNRQPYYIGACALNDSVAETTDTAEAALTKYLDDCEEDPLLDPYQMLFLKTVYNMRVSELIKFSPVDYNDVDPRGAGEYYKAYVSRISAILPDSRVTRVLTPHLDKSWHYIGVLPDIDDNSEKEALKRAQLAYFTALVFGYVQWCQDQYKFKDDNGDFATDLIIVNDGKCDKMHEIYQAMLLSRPLIEAFVRRYEESVKAESNDGNVGNSSYTSSMLYKKIDMLKSHQFSMIDKLSYLELPLLMRVSMGNGEFKDDEAITMVHNFIDFTEKYLEVFYKDPYVRKAHFFNWLVEQIKLMLDNLAQYDPKGILKNPQDDMLVVRIINNLIGILKPYIGIVNNADKECETIVTVWNNFSPNNKI